MKLGIVGAGTIVPQFIRAVADIPQIEVCAIFGREQSREKLERMAGEYEIPEIYTDYAAFLSSSIDTVYIAVPNHLHFPMAKDALLAGKNAIVEKPFTSNQREAEILCEIAQEKHCYLFEAIANIYMPNFIETKRQLDKLGAIKIVAINYSQYSRRYDAFKQGEILPVFDPKMAGGALMDLGVYNIHFVTALFGEPQRIQYSANIERGIDVSGVLTLQYDGIIAVLTAAKDCKAPVSVSVQGDKACLYSKWPANMYTEFSVMKNDGNQENYAENGDLHRMAHELKAFVEMVECKDEERMLAAMAHTVMVMGILDEARKQVGIDIL